MLHFALLLLVGTAIAQNSAQCQTVTVTYPTMHLPYTPVGSHFDTSYTFSISVGYGDNQCTIDIKAPTGYQVAYAGTTTWYSEIQEGFGGGNGNWTFTILLRYTPTSAAGNGGTVSHALWMGDWYYYPTYIMTANLLLVSDPLPIQLASFKAATVTGKGVTLTWTTVSETNNYGFYVQRNSVNLAFIAGHGTTLDQHTYSYIDNPGPGRYRYGLKQVDLDGTATLSETILMDLAGKFALNQNYPNPFNPSTQIAFAVTKEGPVTLRVYDILGREVATLVNESRKPGQYAERFDGGKVSSGVYMYVLRSAEGQLTGRMILSK